MNSSPGTRHGQAVAWPVAPAKGLVSNDGPNVNESNRPLRRSRVRRIFREKRTNAVGAAGGRPTDGQPRVAPTKTPQAGEFIFAPKNSSSEESHACGVAKPQGAVLLVLFLPPRKVHGKRKRYKVNFTLDCPIKLGNDGCGNRSISPGPSGQAGYG